MGFQLTALAANKIHEEFDQQDEVIPGNLRLIRLNQTGVEVSLEDIEVQEIQNTDELLTLSGITFVVDRSIKSTFDSITLDLEKKTDELTGTAEAVFTFKTHGN